MKKILTIIVVVSLSSVLFTIFYSFAEERITLTTYYPAPYGIYRELRADQMAIGSAYRYSPLTNGTLIVSEKVGIGTTSPTYTLDVNTTLQQGLRLQRASGATNIRIDAISGSSQIQFGDGTTLEAPSAWTIGRLNSNNSFRFANSDNTGTNDRMTINTAGLVGIGTTAPNSKLEIDSLGGIESNETDGQKDSLLILINTRVL